MAMSQEALVSLFVGSIVSVVATWVFTHIYYRRAGQDLTLESERLRQETGHTRRLVNILAQALEAARVIDVTWGAGGELNGIVIHMTGISEGSGGVMGTVTVSQTPAAEPPTAIQKDSTGRQRPFRRRRRREQAVN